MAKFTSKNQYILKICFKEMLTNRLKHLGIFSFQSILYSKRIKKKYFKPFILHFSDTVFDIVRSFQINLNKSHFRIIRSISLVMYLFHFQAKVYPYWPHELPLQCADVIIGKTNVSIYDNYIIRELKVTNTKVSASVNVKAASLIKKNQIPNFPVKR